MHPYKDVLGRTIKSGDVVIFTEGKTGLTFGVVDKVGEKTLGVIRVSKYAQVYEDYRRVPITSFNMYIVNPLTIPNGHVRGALLGLLEERFHERFKSLQI